MSVVTDFRPDRIYVLNEVRDEEVTRRILDAHEMQGIHVEYVETYTQLSQLEFEDTGEYYDDAPANILHGRNLLYIRSVSNSVVEEKDRSGLVSLEVFKQNCGRIFNVKSGECAF